MTENAQNQVGASVQAEEAGEGLLRLVIRGRLDSQTTGQAWREATRALERAAPSRLEVDASGIEYCDGSGIGLLVELRQRQTDAHGTMEINGLAEDSQRLLDMFKESEAQDLWAIERPRTRFVEEVGRAAWRVWRDFSILVTFVGELTVNLVRAAIYPRGVRWKDVMLAAEKAGANALPIVTLMGFLIGLIIAFQSAIPMRQFGVEIFIANLIGLILLRELGPLVTAVILAGRTGSAFAAEIGTMKVNEEIDALATMGLDPVRFLTVSRVIAVLVMAPLLTLVFELFGLAGGAVVVRVLGFPLVTYVNQLLSAVSLGDLLGGLVKAVAFGLLVGAIGCLRGLRTKTGPSAVGDSATSAVVSGIILIIIADGIFAVVYYHLGI